jgi:peptide/nickel transport system permease protein
MSRNPILQLMARPSGALASILLAALALLTLAGPALIAADPIAQNIMARFLPPAWSADGDARHLLGTDHLGRDLLARLIHGMRISLLVGLGAASLSAVLGTALGLLAGYGGRALDIAIMRLADIQLAFPLLVLAIAIIGLVGAGLVTVTIVLGLWGWALFARVVRAEVMVQRGRDYVAAARSVGTPPIRIVLRHILPNAMSSVIVLWTFAVAQMIILEGALSFVGLGIRPPTPSLGGIVNDGRQVIELAWWVAVFPGALLVLLVVAINGFGDALRDQLDPRMRA